MLEPCGPDHEMHYLQIGLKKKTAAGAAAAAKEAEEHAKEADQKKSNHLQRKLKARTQQHKLDEVSPFFPFSCCSGCGGPHVCTDRRHGICFLILGGGFLLPMDGF